ncbi:MAG: hypothetical protein AAF802_30965 [Planctomycetota bacterium]
MSSIHATLLSIDLISSGLRYFQNLNPAFSFVLSGLIAAQFIGLILISIGAAKLGFLESYRLAFIGSMLACIPFVTPFYFLGIPFGIWAFVLLADPAVRNSFPDRPDTQGV